MMCFLLMEFLNGGVHSSGAFWLCQIKQKMSEIMSSILEHETKNKIARTLTGGKSSSRADDREGGCICSTTGMVLSCFSS